MAKFLILIKVLAIHMSIDGRFGVSSSSNLRDIGAHTDRRYSIGSPIDADSEYIVYSIYVCI